MHTSSRAVRFDRLNSVMCSGGVQASWRRPKTSDDELISPQLGPRTEERETFTRLLGHLLKAAS
jgi:hypothetical protein